MVKKKSKKDKTDIGQNVIGDVAIPDELPVLPAKDIVGFPTVLMSLQVERSASIRAVEAAAEEGKVILLLAQLDAEAEEVGVDDFHTIGVVSTIVKSLKLADGRYKVLLQGLARAKVTGLTEENDYIVAGIEPVIPPEHVELSAEDEVIINRIRENLQVLVEYDHLPEEMLIVTEEIEDPGTLSDVIIAHYRLDLADAQRALEQLDHITRLKMTDEIITDDLSQFLLSERIRMQARDELTKDQKEYYLREQLKQIQLELGDEELASDDLGDLKQALKKAKLPDFAQKASDKLVQRLGRMLPESSEYALIRTYLEWIADLPWSVRTRERLNLKLAKRILDEDHYGLQQVKERILEYLSVRKLKKDSKGPILCFVGPPGVGKTSLGESVARAINRKFFRMSLGGIRDEAEIRGHRRTYVGALPGRIIQGIKQAGTKNLLFMLDELDKVGADYRGDPAAALLEVLDPAQNKGFVDHYLNLKFDLSEILFIATANTIDTIPQALVDRLEIIRISGYTTEEKLVIAQRHLIPRQIHENGLSKSQIQFNREAIILLIERYTREAGVRNLEREIGSICRKITREYAESGKIRKRVTVALVKSSLGPTKYDPEVDERKDIVGLVRGLAWTIHGGEIMPIEASVAKGNGTLALTGHLGDVMQESGKAAVFYARSNATMLGLDPDFHQKLDVHIHVPGGATPKDGPSAGIAIATALVSALSDREVSKDIAMTGEMTLRGNVLPIGGLKEKALAALRYGIKKVVIPFENIKDLEEIPKEQRDQIKFIPVKHVREVLEIALKGKRRLVKSKAEKASPRKRKSAIAVKC
ncbi:endopeptidase La [Oligoflexia bacterium]|nr:endopeptidase La [Oligoflexia bacterium]